MQRPKNDAIFLSVRTVKRLEVNILFFRGKHFIFLRCIYQQLQLSVSFGVKHRQYEYTFQIYLIKRFL
jgi:hypothetical protein